MNLLEHLIPFYSGKPEAVSICIIIAGAPAMAFNEGSAAELLQAGTRGRQGLARALRTSTGVLGKCKSMGQRGTLHLFCYNIDELSPTNISSRFSPCPLSICCFVAQLQEEQEGGAEGSRDGIGFSHLTAANHTSANSTSGQLYAQNFFRTDSRTQAISM